MQAYIDFMDKLPKGIKIIFCFFILDWFWAFYKLFVSIKNRSAFQIFLSAIWFIIGAVLLWILDLISVISNNTPFWFK